MYIDESNYDHSRPRGIGILLTNVGSPDAPTRKAVRRYLKQFLADPRVIEKNRFVWWFVLNGIILNLRPQRSAKLYQKIWTEQGSPLVVHALKQAELLQGEMRARYAGPLHVRAGMGYGEPSVSRAVAELIAKNCRRILVFPLFPQYSATTVASSFDAVSRVAGSLRWVPELRWIGSYHDDPRYITAVANSVRRFWAEKGKPDRFLMSFHGLPKRYVLAGDPYHCQCLKSARLLAAELELDDQHWSHSFQSRFGKEPWLQPYTDATLEAWGREKPGRVDVVCPGFAADCLETLEEIAMENCEIFQEAGGGEYNYIPALNSGDEHIQMLRGIAEDQLSGWLLPLDQHDESARQQALDEQKRLAETHPHNQAG